ncbi:MAG: hypothetical protein HY690_20380 [Chloroflexi bacterium]|nr:hypothetical protein [Chloroflexota bacterium]
MRRHISAVASPKPKLQNRLALLALIGLLLAELPLALAWCCGPRGLAGLGTFWFINDFAQYEAAMDQGARAAGWLIYDRFTPEVHQPALMFPLYVALGKLAAGSGLPLEVVYRGAEVAARAALVWSLAVFAVWLLGQTRGAVLAFALSLFGMGLGMPAAIAGALLGLEGVYTGNGSYEVNTFGLLFSAPHAALAMALTLALPIAYHAWLQRPRVGPLAALGLGSLALALLHPFHLPALLVALALDAGLRWRRGTALPGLALAVGLPTILAAPFAGYAALTFNLDPFWGATYGAQNVLPSPRPWELPIDYGAVLLLAIPGALVLLRQRSSPARWLLLWTAAMLVAMYLPLPYQRRLSFGLQPALAVLATVGLLHLEAWLWKRGRPGLGRWLQPAALALALVTTATAWLGITASALGNAPMRPYRVEAGEAEAAAWLAGVVQPDQVVLADWDTSNYLAGRLPGRVLGGHPVATLQPTQRRTELATFFQADASERRRLAHAYGADYVFYGPRERALGALEGTPGLQAIYQQPGVAIYAVVER